MPNTPRVEVSINSEAKNIYTNRTKKKYCNKEFLHKQNCTSLINLRTPSKNNAARDSRKEGRFRCLSYNGTSSSSWVIAANLKPEKTKTRHTLSNYYIWSSSGCFSFECPLRRREFRQQGPVWAGSQELLPVCLLHFFSMYMLFMLVGFCQVVVYLARG